MKYLFTILILSSTVQACHYITQKQAKDDARAFAMLKPILKEGNQKAKQALDHYLLSYKDNAVGNPLAEMQESPHAAAAIELYESSYHRVQLDQRWHQAWHILWTQGMRLGHAAFERIIKDYENHPRGNSYKRYLQEAMSSLQAKNIPSQWTPKGIRWMGVYKPSNSAMPSSDAQEQKVSSSTVISRAYHLLESSGFCMSENEVTMAQYKQCIQAGHCSEPEEGGSCLWGTVGNEQMPVNCMTWQQAKEYAQWVGGRLPTQTEWLYAFQGGIAQKTYPWGEEKARCAHGAMSGEEEACSKEGEEGRELQAVCRFAEGRSKQGLCDLLGNVKEWLACEPHCKAESRSFIGSSWRDRVYKNSSQHSQTQQAPRYYNYYDLGIRPVSDCFGSINDK